MRILRKYLPSLLVLAIIFQTLGGGTAVAQGIIDLSPAQREQEIATLQERLRAASERELREGQTTVDEYGRRLFVGQSAVRMQSLNEEIAKRLDDLIARPEGQRRAAMAAATAFVADPALAKALVANGSRVPLEYKRTARSSYNASVPVEVYHAGEAQFEVNTLNDKVIQFGPRPLDDRSKGPVALDLTPRFRQTTLDGQVRQFLARHVGALNLEALDAKVSDKEGVVFFFRWEDPSREVDGIRPFIQVGITAAGQVVSYTNTLDLPDSTTPAYVASRASRGGVRFMPASDSPLSPGVAAQSATGVWIFANNGLYYTEYGPSAYWWTTWGEGYCGRFSSCTPQYMKYTYESSTVSNYARWDHPGYNGGWGTHYVFIPRINATTRQSNYSVVYSGGSTYSFSIDQLSYSDVFVATNRLYAIGTTWLYDTPWGWGTPAGKKVGFDEIRIIY